MLLLLIVAVAAAAPGDDGAVRGLLARYVAEHAASTEAVVARVAADPCGQRFVSADFWGRGLGNSANVALNALAFAVASNRTLLVSDDKKFRAGFWRYLGAVERRWASKEPVLAAFGAAGGCEKCGGCGADGAEAVRDFFPMSARCLNEHACGAGVVWLLCDDAALSRGDAPLVHVRSAVTWLAPLLLENAAAAGELGDRLRALFGAPGVNAWGLLYDALLDPQPAPGDGTFALSSILDETLPRSGDRLFDVGVHVRHRRHQPLDAIEANAARCVGVALREDTGSGRRTVFVATDLPSRVDRLYDAIRGAVGAATAARLDFRCLNASAMPLSRRDALKKVARTDVKAVLAGRDWGELAHERWASVADFLLLANSRTTVGALSSTFSELAGAARHLASKTFLYDPIFDAKGKDRVMYNWPHNEEYLQDHSGRFKCLRADAHWPLPQYVRLRPEDARAWVAQGGCRTR